MTAMVTPAANPSLVIPRALQSSVRILFDQFPQGNHKYQLENENLIDPNIEQPLAIANSLREASLVLEVPHTQWCGFMQLINWGHHPGETTVMFLPTYRISLDPR